MKFLKFDKEEQLKTRMAILESQMDLGNKRCADLQKKNEKLYEIVGKLVNSEYTSN